MNEKIEFSRRLRQAMTDAGYAVSPSVLEQEFNLRWYGRSISKPNRVEPKTGTTRCAPGWGAQASYYTRMGAAIIASNAESYYPDT